MAGTVTATTVPEMAVETSAVTETPEAWGEQAARRWWRGYYEPPPPLDWNDPRHPRFDRLYAALAPSALPAEASTPEDRFLLRLATAREQLPRFLRLP